MLGIKFSYVLFIRLTGIPYLSKSFAILLPKSKPPPAQIIIKLGMVTSSLIII